MSIGDPPRPERQQNRVSYVVEIILDSSVGRRSSRISDLSLGGCYVESIASYREGEEVAFELRSGETELRFTGEVAYVLEGFGFGLKFTDLGEEHLQFLKAVVGLD
ncbi:MAG: PilZ domain-containing protein [Acidobacteria bacterium]|nr:PilZ domain-containing protein [Acidobacteriota bacterium]